MIRRQKRFGVTEVTGFDDPKELNDTGLLFMHEHVMTLDDLIEEPQKFENRFFKMMFAGKAAKKCIV